MNTKIKEMLKEKKEMPESIMNKVQKIGKLTGSYVFGGYNKDTSDIDYLIPPNDLLTFDNLFSRNTGVYSAGSGRESEGIQSLYIKYEGQIYNLLFTEFEEVWETWSNATDIMACIWYSADCSELKPAIKIKRNRVKLFETLKSILFAVEEAK